MKLPKLPAPTRTTFEPTDEFTSITHFKKSDVTQYGLACAEAMREACAAVVQSNADACDDGSLLQVYLASNAAAIKALEIERHARGV